jgi:flagellar protein FliS
MREQPHNEYLKSQVMTASPEQLQMMLYDGAIRFCEQARQDMQAEDIGTQHDRLLRAQRIVLELSGNLKADMFPELCGKLASLYNYVYRRLIDANLQRDAAALDEAMDLLRYQRDTWQLLLEKLRVQRSGQASPETASIPAADAAMPPAATAVPPRPAGGLSKLVGGRLSLEG